MHQILQKVCKTLAAGRPSEIQLRAKPYMEMAAAVKDKSNHSMSLRMFATLSQVQVLQELWRPLLFIRIVITRISGNFQATLSKGLTRGLELLSFLLTVPEIGLHVAWKTLLMSVLLFLNKKMVSRSLW